MNAATRVCDVMARHDMPNPAARLLGWLAGVAEITGGFPVEVSSRQIREGFTTPSGEQIAGTNNHHETVMGSLAWLEENGIVKVADGKTLRFGKQAMRIELCDE